MSSSRIFVFAAFCIIAIGCAPFALAHTTVPTVPPVTLTSCEKLNDFNGIYELNAHEFVQTVNSCDTESRHSTGTISNGTAALLKVYNAIKGGQCNFTDEMEEKLINCTNSVIGFQPPFTVQGAKEHFGPNNDTADLRFKDQECLNSAMVRECVESKFSEEKLSTELLGCKQIIMRGFNITATMCRKDVVRGDRGSGTHYLPSDLLILGSVMLVKLVLLFRN